MSPSAPSTIEMPTLGNVLPETPDKIKAKFRCNELAKTEYHEIARLTPVHGGSNENNTYSAATPSGTLELHITNEAVWGFFAPGKEYYLDFTPAEAAA